MRIKRHWQAAFVLIMVAVLVFMPPLIGISLQKWINIGTLFPGMQNYSDIRIVKYKRGWFSSDVTSSIKLSSSHFRSILEGLGTDVENLPDFVELVFVQHIQHGPFFYTNQFPHWLGMAAIDSKLIIPPGQQAVFNHLNIRESILRRDQSIVGLTGRLYSHIEISSYHFNFPDADLIAQLGSIKADVWQWLFSDRIKGNITFANIYLEADGSTSLVLPDAIIQFDLKKDKNGLWIGTHSLSLPHIILRDISKGSLELNGMQTNGRIKESGGLLTARKKISFENMQYQDQSIGPLMLQVSADHINAEAVANLIDTYADIKEHGELYESQLQQKIFSLLPAAIAPGASLRLDNFEIRTPDGILQMDAKLAWPKDISPTSMRALVQSSKLNASLRVSTRLVDQVISLVSKLIYLYQVPPKDRGTLVDLNNSIRLSTEQNNYLIMDLVQANQLPREDSLELQTLIQNKVPYDQYASAVKTLLFTHKITRSTLHLLDWYYANLTNQADNLDDRLQRFEQDVERQFHNELAQLLKLGFVVKKNEDYLVSLVREKGVIRVNGKKLQ